MPAAYTHGGGKHTGMIAAGEFTSGPSGFGGSDARDLLDGTMSEDPAWAPLATLGDDKLASDIIP